MIETKFKHTDIGLVPEDWEVKTLDEIGSFSKGAGISRAESQTGKTPAIRYGELYTDHDDYIRGFKSHISEEVAAKSRRIHKGDILFTASGETKEDIGKSVSFINDFEAYAGGDLIILSPKIDCDPIFMGYITNSKSAKIQKASKGQGDAVVHIVIDDVKSIEIPLPPFHEQQRIASALMKVDDLISNLEKLIAKKQAIKKGAMQELLTGKKRLPGFKREWKEIRLGTLVEKITTGKLDANAMCATGQYPFFTCAKEVFKIDSYAFDDEALLISGNGENVGYIHYYKGKFNAYQRTYVLTGFLCDIFYLEQYLLLHLKDRIRTEKSNSNTPFIKMDTIADMIINIPHDINEQRAIAHVLSTMDSEIYILEKKRDKYMQIKQGMMRDLLTGRIRLVENVGKESKLYSISTTKKPFKEAMVAEPHPD